MKSKRGFYCESVTPKCLLSRFLIGFLVCVLVLALAPIRPITAQAATSVDTFAELKAACQKSGTVQITSKIAVTDTITIPSGVTVYLTCTHDAGSTTTDIYRAQGFHGHLFKVNDGATVYVRCAIDGNNKDGSGNLRGTGATGTESTGYYGQAMILNYGHVVMDNDMSVLKNNYNAYNNDYKTGLLWTYNGTKYYGLGSGGEGETDLAGSAILCVNGKFTMSNGQIYGCYADNGPAIYVCNGYAGDVIKISGGKIHDNLARRYGGAIFAASRKPYSSYSNSSSFVGSRTLNSTGSNALVTVSGGSIYKNVAKLNSGAVWVGFGGTFYMSGGSIYSNKAIEEGGGGLRLNAGGAGTTGGWMCFANPGGQAWIAGGSIYSNTCATNGGAITVPDNDDANNQLKITGGNIYSNTAGSNGGGVYCASKLVYSAGNIRNNTASGNGGGVYLTGTGTLTMSGGSVYSNTATNHGGGVYLTTAGPASTISGGNIYSNTADYGGGVSSLRTNGLTVSNAKIYNNTASTNGGGIRSTGKLTINSGFFYGNTNIGVYVAGGSATINGGKFGVSAYTDYSTYTVARNTVSQLTIAANTTVTVNGTSYPRFVSSVTDSEGIGANKGIVNNGTLTFTNTSSNAIDMYGTGTSLYNTGTVNINGNFNILSSGKDGATTVQKRLGIQNTATGTVTMNSADAEIKYCGYRGVVNNGSFTLKAGKIYNCTSADVTADNGGGVLVTGDDSAFNMSGGAIYNNKANYGAGVYFTTSGKAGTLSGGSIYSNTATKSGGGIGNSRTAGVTLSGCDVYNNTAGYGGGVYNAGALNLKGSDIYSNNAVDSQGGGIYVSGDNSALNMTSGTIHDNTAKTHGGGVYFTTAGKASTISGGSIYGNDAGGSGGGVFTCRTNGVTLSGGSIYENSAVTYGGGLYVSACPVTMTGGTIYTNTADTGKGNGVFVAGASTFKMSKAALVKSDNDVFLNSYNYITVPEKFTGTQNVRAVVAGDNFATGRVIAKYGNGTTDAGSNALYWDAAAPDMSKQYFTVAGEVLRSGDQGAASNSSSGIVAADVFISEKYTLSFNGNLSGATVTVPSSISKYWNETKSVTFADASANVTYYKFAGWNTAADGSGTTYTSPMTYSANSDIVLYAQWKGISYTVKYNGNGATGGSTASSSHVYGIAKNLTANGFTRTGYTFAGWNTKADGSGTAYADKASVKNLATTAGATVNLYAQWTPITYTVKYDGNGSTGGSTASSTHTYDEAKALTANGYTKIGYVFAGWNTKADGSGTAYADKASVKNLTSTNGGTVTLYAQWKAITYTVKYDGNGATGGSTASSTHTYDEAKALTANGFTKTGYVFSGWNTKADGSGTAYADKASVKNLTSTNGGTVTLYAQWKPITYTVKYDGNGSTGGTTASSTHTYDVAKALTANGFTKTGYVFTGWNRSADGSGTSYTDKQSVKNLTSTNGGTVTLYAQWKAGTGTKYTVNHYQMNTDGSTYALKESESKTGATGATLTLANLAKSYTGFTYKEGKVGGSVITTTTILADGSRVIDLYYARNQYKVTLSKGTGIASVSGAGTYYYGASVTINATVSTGYTWSKWSGTHETTTQKYTFTMPAGNVSDTANAVANTYTITLDRQSGTGGSSAFYEVYGSKFYTDTTNKTAVTSVSVPSRTGYIFGGYYTSTGGSGTQIVDASGSIKIANTYFTANTTVYAKWTPITYTVKYDRNGSTGGSTASSTHTYDVAKALTANGFTKTGYVFAGWNTKADGSGTAYADKASVKNLTSTNGGTVTLYAQWKAITYTVKYDGNGATGGSTASSTHTYDVAKNLTANGFTKTGYVFTGWNRSADGSGTSYTDKQSVKNLTSTNGGTVTLYAQWKAGTGTKYTVNHYQMNTDGSTYALKESESKTGTTGATLTLANLAKSYTGFTYKEGKVGGSVVTTTTILADGSRVIDLYYSRNQYTVTLSKGTGIASVSGAGTYYYGASVTINATVSTGYTWGKWTGTHETTTQKYTFTMPAGNVTDTANAVANTYTITLDRQSGTGGSSAFYEVYGSKFYIDTTNKTAVTSVSVPTRVGYTFGGYYTSTGGSGLQIVDASGSIKIANTYFTANTTVYAKWTPITYTVKYDGNGSTGGSTASSTHTYDVAKALTANGFTKTGYVFAGWNTKADGSGTAYADKASVKNLTSTNGGTVTLYAQWKPITYTVKYDGNGSTGGSTASSTHTYDVAKALTANGYTKTGYTFTGWNTKADGSGTAYADKASVKNLTSTNGGTVTLYAQWVENVYTVQYDGNGATGGATVSSKHTVGTPQNLTKNGFVKTGYQFIGWNSMADGSGTSYADEQRVVDLTSTPGGTVILYAQWKAITYTVKYDGNGSTGGTTASSTHTYDVAKNLTANGFTKTGYVFTGWNTKADGSGTAYADKASVKNLSAVDGATVMLYAQWKPIGYTVKYDGNGADGGSTADSTHTYDVAKNLTKNGFERTDFRFIGWNSKADGTGTLYTDEQAVKNLSVTDGATVILYAQWELIDNTGPEITAVDRWFLLDEAQSGVITFDELMSTASAVDDTTDFSAGEGIFTIVDYCAEDFTSFESAGSATITYYAEDLYGNGTYKTVTVFIVDEKTVPSAAGGDVAIRDIRFIGNRYYRNVDGDFVPEAHGGVRAGSKWVTESDYVTLLTDTLANLRMDGSWASAPVYSFTFDCDELAAARLFVDANGPGSSLMDFYNTYIE